MSSKRTKGKTSPNIESNQKSNQNSDQIEVYKNKWSKDRLHTQFPALNWRVYHTICAKRKGLKLKSGPFSPKEDEILTKNWHNFCDDYPVYNPHLFFGFFSQNKKQNDENQIEIDPNFKERQTAKRIIKRSKMYLRLSKGLKHRSIAQIYQRSRKLFSGLNKSNEIKPSIRPKILESRVEDKPKRAIEISETLFADNKAVDEIVRRNINLLTLQTYRKGVWTAQEDHTLTAIIRGMGLKIDSDMPWAQIARKMKTRNDHQCRERFNSVTFSKSWHSNPLIKSWSSDSSRQFIYLLKKGHYSLKEKIDWKQIEDKIGYLFSVEF